MLVGLSIRRAVPGRRRQDRALLLDVRDRAEAAWRPKEERSEDDFFSMKTSQEVREFAAKQNADSYLAATASVEGAEEGMDYMSERFRASGREVYLPEAE